MKRAITYFSRLVLLVFAGLLCAAQCPAQDLAAKIDDYMSVVARSRFSGSILVARDGKVLAIRSYGRANLEDESPNTPQTKFRLGSLSKQFTAMAILILQERGALNVQDPICNYLPRCPDTWQSITIRHLLTHTSGIQNSDYTDTIKLPMSVDNTLERLSNKPLEFAPDKLFRYSNSNYVLLGYIIEKVSGQPYDIFVQEKIFQPLQMTNSGYDYPRRILKQRAAGYSQRGDALINALYIDMSIPYSAGGLYSTVEDMYKWDQSLYTEKLVSKKSLDAMFTPFKGNYGYGWYIAEQGGHRFVSHSGWIDGFANSFGRYPDDRVTVIVLSNLDSVPANTIARGLGGIVLGLRHDMLKERRAIKVNPKNYDAYVGRYELTPNFIVTVTEEGGRLMGQATGHPKIELFPESENTFFVKEFDAQIKFIKNARGVVVSSLLSLNGKDAQAKKL